MWTSSRTTSGRSARIVRTASSTEPASARTSTRPSSSARTPLRKIAWSSTITTRRQARSSALASQGELDLGARAGLERIVALPPWRSMRPMIDSRTPRRSAGIAVGVEARRRGRARRPGRASAPSRRRRRSAPASPANFAALVSASRVAATSGAAALVERAVADGDDVDRHAVRVLDLGRDRARARRRGCRPRPGAIAVEQPGAQLALLAAREGRHLARDRRRASASGSASAAPSRAGGRRPRRAPGSGSARPRSAARLRPRRHRKGARMRPSAAAATTTASTTSRAWPRAPLA